MTDTNTAQMVVDLQAADDAVRAQGWVAPGLGVPGASMGLLGSTFNPLTGLISAGLGWFMPFVSFLGEGLTQLQGGNAASVGSGSQSFGDAGQDIGSVAGSYRDSITSQTSGWSGTAASEYREAGAQHADGIAGLGQASTTTGSAIIGAGQVVAQAIAEVTELIAEAVAQIVPIMTQAMARAGETFGQSVVEAIPPCVGIAVEYALRIAAKLAALVASGQNLLKLVQGAMAVVDLLKQALTGISQRSIRADAEPEAGAGGGGGAGGGQAQGGSPASTLGAVGSDNAMAGPGDGTGAAGSGSTGSSGPTSGAGGFGGGSTPGGSAGSGGLSVPTVAPLGVASQSTGAVPPSHGIVPDASRHPGHVAGGGMPTGAAPGGGVPVGAAGLSLAGGTRTGAGRGGGEGVRQDGRPQPARTSGSGGGAPGGGVPLAGLAGARAAGSTDKEHQRKYGVLEQHDDEIIQVAPPVIGASKAKD